MTGPWNALREMQAIRFEMHDESESLRTLSAVVLGNVETLRRKLEPTESDRDFLRSWIAELEKDPEPIYQELLGRFPLAAELLATD